jgi:hypothetical protein
MLVAAMIPANAPVMAKIISNSAHRGFIPWAEKWPVPRKNQPERVLVAIGTLMFAAAAKMDLVRLAIPRRVYTQSHIDYVVEAILHVW